MHDIVAWPADLDLHSVSGVGSLDTDFLTPITTAITSMTTQLSSLLASLTPVDPLAVLNVANGVGKLPP